MKPMDYEATKYLEDRNAQLEHMRTIEASLRLQIADKIKQIELYKQRLANRDNEIVELKKALDWACKIASERKPEEYITSDYIINEIGKMG